MTRLSGSPPALVFAAMLATQSLAAWPRDAIEAANASFAATTYSNPRSIERGKVAVAH
jgi:hypothetical protein